MILETKKDKREFAENAWGGIASPGGNYIWQCDKCGYRSHAYDKMATIRLVEKCHDCKSGYSTYVSTPNLMSTYTAGRHDSLHLSPSDYNRY